jgi:hypothetical protein
MTWLLKAIPKLLFVFGLVVVALFYGVYAGSREYFPYGLLRAASLTSRSLLSMIAGGEDGFAVDIVAAVPDIAPATVPSRRIQTQDADATGRQDAFLMAGGPRQFLDICPGEGCLAVAMARNGKVIHAWPYRAAEFRRNIKVDLPYESFSSDPSANVDGLTLAQLPGGDLIAIFWQHDSFPDGGGIARIDPEGHFRWYRRDYAHHWPTATGPNEIIYPSTELRRGVVDVLVAGLTAFHIGCAWKYYADTVMVVDGEGNEKERISVLDAVLASPYRMSLGNDWYKCDPTHVNYVRPVGKGIAAALDGVAPDDLLISMRHLNAIGIMDRKTHRFKRWYTGEFFGQHSVQPLADAKVIMFDNLGNDSIRGISRVLELDLVTGNTRMVFPSVGEKRPFFSFWSGNLDQSADGKRVLISATNQGFSYELRLADGKVLTTFDNLHMLENSSGQHTFRLAVNGLYYLRTNLPEPARP